MKIAVLYGGVSAEREVSLSSGKGIIKALEANGHDVIGIDFHPNKLDELLSLQVDIVFIGLHGKYGEDGKIQALLDMLNIPYVGSGVLGSALAMDKAKSKAYFEKQGIRIAKSITVRKNAFNKEFNHNLSYPLVVKPNSEGSTIGLSIVKDKKDFYDAMMYALKHDEVVMVEEFVEGKEVTVAVLGKKDEEKALPVVEIIPKNEIYDYESKYAPGGSEHIVPANVDEKTTRLLQNNAVKAHQVLDCNVYSRVDFIVPTDGSEPVILEVNTLPGMTPTSLFPDAARAIGLSYEAMIEELVKLSLN
ncbi:D-alanine--D-alanine ligase [Lottiidibacillus patelloidae]|uniref:D-alanine--D-alanine ligase n=1 Tax=Lottiidibacillus patelloidae TaxID=2670334 RepID=A0A263BU52_9BACI|nr:D-alanine--D-alanine ligase [Lottiidibacillus patelloidae]OZM57249.1 D-alanine--D-alanine ligase [Lottiidibacillus patelloidae]